MSKFWYLTYRSFGMILQPDSVTDIAEVIDEHPLRWAKRINEEGEGKRLVTFFKEIDEDLYNLIKGDYNERF